MITENSNGHRLQLALIKAGFSLQMAKLITAQAAHETGNFSSMLFTDYNNPFGMKQPYKRKTTSQGPQYGYATYPDIETAAKDFMLYWKDRKNKTNFKAVPEYVAELKKDYYFEDSLVNYEKGVSHFYNLFYESKG
jgi:uncharacterized FlgJ-related protein